MRKNVFLVVALWLLFYINVNAQDEQGCFEDRMWKYCNYDESYLYSLQNRNKALPLNRLEIGYDKTRNVYSVFIEFDGSKINADVRFAYEGKQYYYNGIDRISGGQVVISCTDNLDRYTENYGMRSKSAITDFEEQGISIYFPEINTRFYAVPIRNDPYKNLSAEEIAYRKRQEELERQRELKRLEQERLERIKREEAAEQERKRREEAARQERIKREKEIENLLPLIDEQKINEQVAIYRNNRILEKAQKINVQFPNSSKAEIDEIIDVLIHLDSSNMDVVRISEQVWNNELDILSMKTHKPYCILNGVSYYKSGNHIFYAKKTPILATVEKGLLGVKKKNAEFTYYGTFPFEVKEWCKKHVIANGFQVLQYICYDNQYFIQPTTVTKESAKVMQGKNPEKRKEVWKTIGSVIGLGILGTLIGIAAAS